jgi:hypothetical protein
MLKNSRIVERFYRADTDPNWTPVPIEAGPQHAWLKKNIK